MQTRFHFSGAHWFRVPLKVLVVAVTVFGMLSIWPALTDGNPVDDTRAIFAFCVMVFFMAAGITVAVALSESYVDLDQRALSIRFEAFFSSEIPLTDIVAVSPIDPRPRWRYRLGLSTDYVERISCSHGGPLIEIELAHARATRLWPRRSINARRFWLAVRDYDRFVLALERAAPHAFVSRRALHEAS